MKYNFSQEFLTSVANAFNMFFFCEISVRMYTYRKACIRDSWFLLDVVAILPPFVDMLLGGEQNDLEMQVFKSIRNLRIFKICRLLRLIRIFKELTLLVNGFIQAAKPLTWIFVLMVLFCYSAAIYCTMVVGHNQAYDE